jgi:hypothetical protein
MKHEALIRRLEVSCLGLDAVDPLRLLVNDVVAALRQTEQEPVAWMWDVNNGGGYTSKGIGFMQTNIPFAKHTSLFTTPPQRTEQEPVAVKRMKEWVEFLKRQSDNGQHMNIPSSFGAGTCWELAIELEQFINTHPPQRTEPLIGCVNHDCDKCKENTWVGLTDEDLDYLCHLAYSGDEEFALAVQAKLKEKNT